MTKLSLIASTVAFMGLFAACSADDPILDPENPAGNGNKVADENMTMYVKVAVYGENGFNGRAADVNGNPELPGDFADGTGKESEIQSIYFVFYDSNDNIVGNVVNVPMDNASATPDPDDTSEKTYEKTVAVSILKGQEKPSKVLCYLNPISLNDIQKPLNVIQTVTRDNVIGAEGLFPMTNSVYYTSDQEGIHPTIAVNIEELYNTEAEAEKSTSPVKIYVERRAARLKFKIAEDILDGNVVKNTYTSGTTSARYPSYDLKFNIEGWDVNAQTRNSYLVKSFRKPDPATAAILAENYTYGELNNAINSNGGTWKWNNSAYHRSYWAVSPAYFVKEYPEVSSDVKGDENLIYIYPQKDDKTHSWNTNWDGSSNYYGEATVGTIALNSDNPAAAIASVVLKGYYTIDGKAIDFYAFQKNSEGKYYIFPKQLSGTTGGMTMMDRFIQLQSVLYKPITRGDATAFEQISMEDIGTAYTTIVIQHPAASVLEPSGTVEGEEAMKVASRHQTLQVTAVPETPLYYANGNGYVQVTDDNLKEVNRALIQQLGFASFYDKGQAYFNIPIRHLGWYRTSNTQKGAQNIDWSKVRVGDFGMVRNHAYSIEVESIEGLGTGIGNPTDPIIPPAETKDYFVKYSVSCLKWALVPSQKVKL